MKKNNCNIIKDILPLYVDEVVSEDTSEFIHNHLTQCESCRKEYEQMKKTIFVPIEKDTKPLKNIKRKWTRKAFKVGIISSVTAIILISSTFFLLYQYGFPVESGYIELSTEFQDITFVIHATHKQGKPLSLSSKEVYGVDENGNRIVTGEIVTFRETFGDGGVIAPDNYTFGYTYPVKQEIDENFDYTITLKFKDCTIVYSMREEGIFELYENLIY